MDELGQEELVAGSGDSENGFESGFVQVSEADALLPPSQGVEGEEPGLEGKGEEGGSIPEVDSDEDIYGGPEEEEEEGRAEEGDGAARETLEDEEKPLSPPPSPVTPEKTGQLIDFGDEDPSASAQAPMDDPLSGGLPENQPNNEIPITSYIVDTETSFDLVKTTPPEFEEPAAAAAAAGEAAGNAAANEEEEEEEEEAEPAPLKTTPPEPEIEPGLGGNVDLDVFTDTSSSSRMEEPQEVAPPTEEQSEVKPTRPPPPGKIEKRVSFSDQPQWSDEPRAPPPVVPPVPPVVGVQDVTPPPPVGPTPQKKHQFIKPAGYLAFLNVLHPVVLYIIYWGDVKLSAVVLGVCLVVLLTLTLNTVLHTTVLLLLSFMVVSLTYIITKIAIDSFYNKKVQNPFHGYLTNRITLPEKEIMEWTGYVVSKLDVYVNVLVRLLLFANIKYSLMFGCSLWLASFFTNCLTLLCALFLLVAVSFSVPWLYAHFQSKIDCHLDKAVSQVGAVLKKVISYIPFGKKSKTE